MPQVSPTFVSAFICFKVERIASAYDKSIEKAAFFDRRRLTKNKGINQESINPAVPPSLMRMVHVHFFSMYNSKKP
jgi:hypothetical protein